MEDERYYVSFSHPREDDLDMDSLSDSADHAPLRTPHRAGHTEDLGGPDYALFFTPGYSASRENDRLREKFTEKELEIARLKVKLASSAYSDLDRAHQAERIADMQDCIDALTGQLDDAQSKMAVKDAEMASERYKVLERVRLAEEKERISLQKMDVLEETLHLHRKRVTKLYKKVDMQQKDLNDAKDAYQCSQDRILELKTALQAETHNVGQLNAALSREKIAYHDLQRRYSALEAEDAKWRQRWQSMMRAMHKAKGSDRAVAFSPSHILEASSISQKHVSPHNVSSTTLHASSPSRSRSSMAGAGKAEHCYGRNRHAEKAESSSSFCKQDAQGAQIGATKCQEDAPEQAKTREKEERARARQLIQFEIERERGQAKLRESAVQDRKEGGLEWERPHESLAASSEDGTREFWAGKDSKFGGMAREDQVGEGNGQNHFSDAVGMPSILRKFELEQECFRKDMEALKLIVGGRE